MATLHLYPRMHATLTFNVRDAGVQRAWARRERRHAESGEWNLFIGLQWQTINSPVLLLMCLCVSESTNMVTISTGSLAAGGNFTTHASDYYIRMLGQASWYAVT